MDDARLNSCGCCEGVQKLTPAAEENRPGLSALSYRVGTYGEFKLSMLAALSSKSPLRILRTRANDDPAIALLDAWAAVLDVLTFYQERIANEGFLRTATERASILELARSIGYELRPGVAASTYLAFELETAQGAPGYASLDIGARVQSVPGPDEKPQIFETIEELQARARWNSLTPGVAQLIRPILGTTTAYFQGVETGLKPGDGILFVGDERSTDPGSERWDFRRVKSVTPDASAKRTKITWEGGLGWKRPDRQIDPAEKNLRVFAFLKRTALFGHNAPDWRTMPDSVRKGYGHATAQEWPDFDVFSIGTRRGLHAEYFQGKDLAKPLLKRRDSQVDFEWAGGSPDPRIAPDNFSVRWIGLVCPEVSGQYTFHTLSDDGVRLWVGGKQLINNWTDHPPTEDVGTIHLEAGRAYDIRLEYYENGGAATIKLSWTPPHGTKQIVPQKQLAPPDIHLDASYPQILQGSWLLFSVPEYDELFQVKEAAEDSRSNFALSTKTTRVTLQGENLSLFHRNVRRTLVFAQSEALVLAETPLEEPVQGARIVLDRKVEGLEAGRTLIVSGKRMRGNIGQSHQVLKLTAGKESKPLNPDENLIVLAPPSDVVGSPGLAHWHLRRADGFEVHLTASQDSIALLPSAASDETVSEVAILKEALSHDGQPTELALEKPLTNIFDRTTVTIAANVARATHGETKQEVLGSGDASQPFQKFILKQQPLTYIPASTPGGTASTLQIRVNDLLWDEMASLYGRDAADQNYVVRLADDGKATVRFGDGSTGARLPSGTENVQANYRVGIGLEGMVKAGQLTLLMTRPLGVKGVRNPLPATGAADPEASDQARQNAPQTVLTLDRIVSLDDYEDFARAFAGIGKARAAWIWQGETRVVQITVAASDGGRVDGDLAQKLARAVAHYSVPHQPFVVESFVPLTFGVTVQVLADRRYVLDKVRAAVRAALLDTFSFAHRTFSQGVTESEVMAVVQGVEGVEAADLVLLKFDPHEIEPHVLLTLSSSGIEVREMQR